MEEIPLPELLDPHRMLLNTRGNLAGEQDQEREQLLERGLRQSCDYGQQLWQCLDRSRAYLLQSIPMTPTERGEPSARARPTGPDDEDGWRAWVDIYAAVSSALTGAHGDSGYGRTVGRREASLRRAASRRVEPGSTPNPPAPAPGSSGGAGRLLAAAGLAFLAGLVLSRPGRTASTPASPRPED